MLRVAKRQDRWLVTQFIAKHNHELATPKSTQFLRSHKRFTKAQRDLMDVLDDSGVCPSKIVSILSHESGGVDNLNLTERDIYNYLKRKREKHIDRGDAQTMLDYLRNCQTKDPGFFYAIQSDIDGCLANCFWVDSRSRMAYKYFGDVVAFDPTYLKNKYKMPFVPIAGVNHHFQSILFGCALLWDETEETFIWLLRTWLEAMSEKAPSMIITDQDSAISNAIVKILPNTNHHYCMWHIEKKFPENLSHVYHQNEDFKKDFNNGIHGSSSPEDFEDAWMDVTLKYNLQGNSWLDKIYFICEKWIPAFSHRIFCAGMSTTQRSESLNKFFKDYVNANTLVSKFVKQFEEALDARYNKEWQQNFKSMNSRPVLKTLYLIEAEAYQVYTKKIFKLFQDELINAQKFVSDKVEIFCETKLYKVHKIMKQKPFYMVSFEPASCQAYCSCKKFEFMGILCRHILTIFLKKKVHSLPQRYILRRWTKDAKKYITSEIVQDPSPNNSSDSPVLWYNSAMLHSLELCELASRSKKHYDHALYGISKLVDELCNLSCDALEVEKGNRDDNLISHGKSLRDPIQVVTKRRPRSVRIKSSVEKSCKKSTSASIHKRNSDSKGTHENHQKKKIFNEAQTNPHVAEMNSEVVINALVLCVNSLRHHQESIQSIPFSRHAPSGFMEMLMAASNQSSAQLFLIDLEQNANEK